jgi:hypothetical protein
MYVGTERGNIFVVEVINNRGSESIECKVRGRLAMIEEFKDGDVLNMETQNSLLYVHIQGSSKV